MWVISVNYLFFFTLIFHNYFFSKKRYLFRNVAINGAPLYCCVRWDLNMEGQPTVCCTTCMLLRLFLQQIWRPRNTRIRFHFF